MSRTNDDRKRLMEIYKKLLQHFGPQGWWPMSKGFAPPEWEVCIGAILTQNTNWKNVEKALENLKKEGILSPEEIKKIKIPVLENLIKPSGFYRQKAGRLKIFSDFVLSFGSFENFKKKVTREQLLQVKGLGPETADSILLYAVNRPVFIIDAYTRRIFTRIGFENCRKNKKNYEDWRYFFESNLKRDVEIYREFHALIVEHAKNFCRKEPLCGDCVLNRGCALAGRT